MWALLRQRIRRFYSFGCTVHSGFACIERARRVAADFPLCVQRNLRGTLGGVGMIRPMKETQSLTVEAVDNVAPACYNGSKQNVLF